MMDVLFVTNQLDVGGIETNLVRLTAALSERGHRCVTAAAPGRISDEIVAAGGRVVPLRGRVRPGAVARDILTLGRELRANPPDVIHTFSALSNALVQSASRRRRRRPPVVASVMGLDSRPNEAPSAVRRRARFNVAGADLVIVTSPAIDKVLREAGIKASRMVHDTVVGVETSPPPSHDERLAIRAELGVAPKDLLITTIGRLEPRKSHDLFLRAAARIHAAAPRSRFLVVGDGALEYDLRALTADLGIEASVAFLGNRRDVPAILAATDVYVRPGVVEGFVGITVLEAQAVATPVVSFRTDDVQLAIEDGVSGLLAEPGDVESLATKVIELLDDPERCWTVGTAGRRLCVERFGVDNVVDRLLATYEGMAPCAGS